MSNKKQKKISTGSTGIISFSQVVDSRSYKNDDDGSISGDPRPLAGTDSISRSFIYQTPMYTGNDAELAVSSKKILKKDPITKLKGLSEIIDIMVNRKNAVLSEFLPYFLFAFPKIALDNSSKVRQQLVKLLSLITQNDEEASEACMKPLIGLLWMLMSDPVGEVCEEAKLAFSIASSSKHRQTFITEWSLPILNHIDFMLKQQSNSLSDVTQMSTEEADERFSRVTVSTIDSLSMLITELSCDENARLLAIDSSDPSKVSYQTVINGKLWRKALGGDQSCRKAVYNLLTNMCKTFPQYFLFYFELKQAKGFSLLKMSDIVSSMFTDETSQTVLPDMLAAVLGYLKVLTSFPFEHSNPNVWSHISLVDTILPRFKGFATSKSKSIRSLAYDFLPSFLACFPLQKLSQQLWNDIALDYMTEIISNVFGSLKNVNEDETVESLTFLIELSSVIILRRPIVDGLPVTEDKHIHIIELTINIISESIIVLTRLRVAQENNKSSLDNQQTATRIENVLISVLKQYSRGSARNIGMASFTWEDSFWKPLSFKLVTYIESIFKTSVNTKFSVSFRNNSSTSSSDRPSSELQILSSSLNTLIISITILTRIIGFDESSQSSELVVFVRMILHDIKPVISSIKDMTVADCLFRESFDSVTVNITGSISLLGFMAITVLTNNIAKVIDSLPDDISEESTYLVGMNSERNIVDCLKLSSILHRIHECFSLNDTLNQYMRRYFMSLFSLASEWETKRNPGRQSLNDIIVTILSQGMSTEALIVANEMIEAFPVFINNLNIYEIFLDPLKAILSTELQDHSEETIDSILGCRSWESVAQTTTIEEKLKFLDSLSSKVLQDQSESVLSTVLRILEQIYDLCNGQYAESLIHRVIIALKVVLKIVDVSDRSQHEKWINQHQNLIILSLCIIFFSVLKSKIYGIENLFEAILRRLPIDMQNKCVDSITHHLDLQKQFQLLQYKNVVLLYKLSPDEWAETFIRLIDLCSVITGTSSSLKQISTDELYCLCHRCGFDEELFNGFYLKIISIAASEVVLSDSEYETIKLQLNYTLITMKSLCDLWVRSNKLTHHKFWINIFCRNEDNSLVLFDDCNDEVHSDYIPSIDTLLMLYRLLTAISGLHEKGIIDLIDDRNVVFLKNYMSNLVSDLSTRQRKSLITGLLSQRVLNDVYNHVSSESVSNHKIQAHIQSMQDSIGALNSSAESSLSIRTNKRSKILTPISSISIGQSIWYIQQIFPAALDIPALRSNSNYSLEEYNFHLIPGDIIGIHRESGVTPYYTVSIPIDPSMGSDSPRKEIQTEWHRIMLSNNFANGVELFPDEHENDDVAKEIGRCIIEYLKGISEIMIRLVNTDVKKSRQEDDERLVENERIVNSLLSVKSCSLSRRIHKPLIAFVINSMKLSTIASDVSIGFKIFNTALSILSTGASSSPQALYVAIDKEIDLLWLPMCVNYIRNMSSPLNNLLSSKSLGSELTQLLDNRPAMATVLSCHRFFNSLKRIVDWEQLDIYYDELMNLSIILALSSVKHHMDESPAHSPSKPGLKSHTASIDTVDRLNKDEVALIDRIFQGILLHWGLDDSNLAVWEQKGFELCLDMILNPDIHMNATLMAVQCIQRYFGKNRMNMLETVFYYFNKTKSDDSEANQHEMIRSIVIHGYRKFTMSHYSISLPRSFDITDLMIQSLFCRLLDIYYGGLGRNALKDESAVTAAFHRFTEKTSSTEEQAVSSFEDAETELERSVIEAVVGVDLLNAFECLLTQVVQTMDISQSSESIESGYNDTDDSEIMSIDYDRLQSKIQLLHDWILIIQSIDTISNNYRPNIESNVGSSSTYNPRIRALCGSYFRRSNQSALIMHLFVSSLPILPSKPDSKFNNLPSLQSSLQWNEERATESFQCLAMIALYRSIHALPALVRNYWLDLTYRPYKDNLSRFLVNYVRTSLVSREMKLIRNAVEQGIWNNDISVRGSVHTGEVIASLIHDEAKIEIRITLPTDYPIKNVEVEKLTSMGVDEKTWRRWALQIVQLLSMSDGTLVDAVMLWKNSLQSEFEGVEPCPICYNTLHPKTLVLPSLSCPTCKNKFHSLCLSTWFKSSGKNECVLCRQPFSKH